MEIFDASKVLSKIIQLTQIKSLSAEVINFRNMATIQIKITTDSVYTKNITIPRIREESPALSY